MGFSWDISFPRKPDSRIFHHSYLKITLRCCIREELLKVLMGSQVPLSSLWLFFWSHAIRFLAACVECNASSPTKSFTITHFCFHTVLQSLKTDLILVNMFSLSSLNRRGIFLLFIVFKLFLPKFSNLFQ